MWLFGRYYLYICTLRIEQAADALGMIAAHLDNDIYNEWGDAKLIDMIESIATMLLGLIITLFMLYSTSFQIYRIIKLFL